MQTTEEYTFAGITIPAWTECEDTESCAVIVRYDESKGCKFDTKSRYHKPAHGTPIAVPRRLTDTRALELVVDEAMYQ